MAKLLFDKYVEYKNVTIQCFSLEANSIEEAYERLLVVLESDVEYKDVEAFKFKEVV